MDKAISLTLYLTLFLFFFFHLLKFPFQTIKAGTFSRPNVTMHCELVEKKEVIVNMDSGVFLTQKSSSSSSSYIAAGSRWAEWACAHPDFPGVEKRTEAEIDNISNFIYSEKATKFCEIFTLLLTGTT